MKNGPVISLVTPCYNGAAHIRRFLESVIAQTYTQLELILVNDGSTDGTEKIVLSYKPAFEKFDIRLVYVYQENTGLGGAINAGLKKVTGKYLCWPDADDYLEPESVELRLKVLEENPDYAAVTSDAFVRYAEFPQRPAILVSSSFRTNNDPNQFMHMLRGESIFCSGTHMVRSDVFFDTHPGGQIYPARKGQNYQMLLPVYHRHKRYFLNRPLYNYIRYGSSMSQIDNSDIDEKITRNDHHRKIIFETLAAMNMDEAERSFCRDMVISRFSRINYRIALEHLDYNLLEKEYKSLRDLKQASAKIRIQYALARARRLTKSSGLLSCFY